MATLAYTTNEFTMKWWSLEHCTALYKFAQCDSSRHSLTLPVSK